MTTITISGLEHEWKALTHLNDWVSKNAKSYFGKDAYRKAKGCVRDDMVTLGSVDLGMMRGAVSDGNGQFYLCSVVQRGGWLTAACNCSSYVVPAGDTKEARSTDLPCHHLAAFLLYISKAKMKETAAFVCGDPNSCCFVYKGYLAAFKTYDELVELCAKHAPEHKQNMSGVKFKALVNGRSKAVAVALAELEVTIDAFEGASHGGNPVDLSIALNAPLDKLIPLFKNHPQEVMMILKRVITLLSEADLEFELTDEVEVDPEDFDTYGLAKMCILFAQSMPAGTHEKTLKELIGHAEAVAFDIDWKSAFEQRSSNIGHDELLTTCQDFIQRGY